MTDKTMVYWKRKEDSKEGDYISGYCSAEDVPSYGEVGSCALPDAVEVSVDEDGTIVAKSPLIIGTSKAYRYQLRMSPEFRKNIAEQSDYSLEVALDVYCCDAPIATTTRENWWWYSKDKFRTLGYNKRPPVTLAKKWKRAMLEVLLENHPDKDKKLADWDQKLTSYKKHVKSKSDKRTSSHQKAPGDLVVMPHPTVFESGVTKQIFCFDLSYTATFSRKSYCLKVKNTRYKIRHGSAMTFKNGTAPDDSLSLPIRVAMALIAWSRAPMDSAHQILASRQTFEPLTNTLIEDLKKMDVCEQDTFMKWKAFSDHAAAMSAVTDFLPDVKSCEDNPRKHEEISMISDRFQHVHALLQNRRNQIESQLKQAENAA
jgi:hypothetical protein